MSESPRFRRHRCLRLLEYDYSQAGAYFVTICVADRRCLLGNINDGEMHLSSAGMQVEKEWQAIPDRFPGLEVDVFAILPNHLHGIVVLPYRDANNAKERTPSPRLGDIIRAFKAASTRMIRVNGMPNFAWQHNYFEHVIRSEAELDRVRQYIANNVLKWELDQENPAVEG